MQTLSPPADQTRSAVWPNPDCQCAIIIPACNEEESIEIVLQELGEKLPMAGYRVVVGVNGSTDRTAERARKAGALVAETPSRGYGHGCMAAITAADSEFRNVDAYLFFAADGANDPKDIPRLVELFSQGYGAVLGSRTTTPGNRAVMGRPHLWANRFLGLWATLMSRRFFKDLGPHRIIRADVFHAMRLREWGYGWTIEAQIRAAQLGVSMREIPVAERPRIAGLQKVGRVSWQHSLHVGLEIFRAGWRTFLRGINRHLSDGVPGETSPLRTPSASGEAS